MNYLLIDAIFLAFVGALYIIRRPRVAWKRIAITFGVLCLLTLIFDNLIIALHIVAYHHEHILGLRLGLVPIEDFAYTIAIVLIVPILWGAEHAE